MYPFGTPYMTACPGSLCQEDRRGIFGSECVLNKNHKMEKKFMNSVYMAVKKVYNNKVIITCFSGPSLIGTYTREGEGVKIREDTAG